MKVESQFQKDLIKEIKGMAPRGDITVLKNDATIAQGIPDLVVFYKDRFAMLEVKKSENASHRPNQDWYIKKFANESFGYFIYPENKDKVLNAMKTYLRL